MKSGFSGFSDHEVVELILTLALPRSDVKPQAKALVKCFGTLKKILDAPIEDIRRVKGLGSVAPVALKIIRDTATFYLQQSNELGESFLDLKHRSDLLRMRIGALPNEVFDVAFLDSGYRLMRDGIERISEGTIDRATVYPRRVIESALKRGAAAIVLAHNHPNGSTTPSEEDKLLTRAIVLASETISLKVFDHIIVSTQETFSFQKEGLL